MRLSTIAGVTSAGRPPLAVEYLVVAGGGGGGGDRGGGGGAGGYRTSTLIWIFPLITLRLLVLVVLVVLIKVWPVPILLFLL